MLSKLGCLRRFAASPLPKSQLNRTKESVHIVYNSTVELRGISTMFAVFLSLTLLLSSRRVTATLSASNTGPVVQLSYGSFQVNATADLEEFLGIPYAAPPYASYSNFACAYTDNHVFFPEKHWESPICSSGTASNIRWSSPNYWVWTSLPAASNEFIFRSGSRLTLSQRSS